MTDTPSELLPRYYLAHDTPAGRRYAYPVPLTDGDARYARPLYDHPTRRWTTPEGIRVEESGRWLITAEPIWAAIVTWSAAPKLVGWRKRPEPPTDGVSRRFWESEPDEPDAEMLAHVADCGYECAVCGLFRAAYERVTEPQPDQVGSVSFEGWRELPGEPDPDPLRSWVVADPSLLAIYGPHTAHLWPGYLPGLRARVYELLRADPRVQYVFDGERHRDQPQGSLQTTVQIPWATPKTELRTQYGYSGRKLKGKRPVPAPIAHSATTTVRVPSGLSAPTKADAITAWHTVVNGYLEQLVPVDVVACNHCDGHGHLLREQESDLSMADVRRGYDA